MSTKQRLVGFDYETYMPPRHGKATLAGVQEAVCLGLYYPETGENPLYLAEDGTPLILDLLRDPEVVLVGHNCAAFDLPVFIDDCQRRGIEGSLEAVFDAIDGGRIIDTMLASQLGSIAQGGVARRPNDLAGCAKRYLGIDVEGKHGKDAWRKRYAELAGVPVEYWPKAAYDYARLDAEYTVKIWQAMTDRPRVEHSADLGLQICAAFSLGLAKAHGLRVDPDWATRLWDYFAGEQARYAGELLEHGIMRADGTKDTAKIRNVFEDAWVAKLGHVPAERRSDTGLISTAKEHFFALSDLYSDDEDMDPAFRSYAQYNRATSNLSIWLAPIMDAVDAGHSLHPSYTVLLNTGRVSAKSPSIMNIPGRLRGDDQARRDADPTCVVPMDIRGCFVPAPGFVFVACDYVAFEMSGLAQVLANIAGEITPLGTAINEGQDLHCKVAAYIVGSTYEEAVRLKDAGDPVLKRYRGLAKVMNFSAPTGAGLDGYVTQARTGYGLTITVNDARRALDAWQRAWPEMRTVYDPWIHGSRSFDGSYRVQQHGPGGIEGWAKRGRRWRVRRCEAQTEAANTAFQGIAADAAKYAMYLLAKACYVDRTSPLYGSRVPLFVHDEFVIETPAEGAEAAQAELERIMVLGAQSFIPDIAIRVESNILPDRWSK
jgi:DNA polymerase I-like protein with 3'-5' exonuclease and polymerase domains